VALVRSRQRMAFLRGLLSMLKAGVPLTTALDDLGRVQTAGLRQILRRAGDRLRAGATLADALDELADLVDPVTRALLAGGEQSGRLDQVLARRLDQMEESRRLAGQLLAWISTRRKRLTAIRTGVRDFSLGPVSPVGTG
jgi:type II secretory pathway component PulF